MKARASGGLAVRALDPVRALKLCDNTVKKKQRARLERLSHAYSAKPDQSGRALLEAALFPRARDAYLVPDPWPHGEALVHDVRVATRRLVEALELVAPLVPPAVLRALRSDAKKLRRILGARREADVLLSDFRELVEQAGVSGSAAERVAEALDRAGSEGSAAVERKYPQARVHRLAARLVAAVDVLEDVPDASWRDVASPHLHDRAAAAEAGLDALKDHEAREAHHALRITFKRLRYAAELLAPVFPEPVGEIRVREVKKLQDVLGQLQDADDLLDFLDRDVVREATDEDGLERLRALSRTRRVDRLSRAREVADAHAQDVIAAAYRASGKIGLLEQEPTEGSSALMTR